MKRVVTLLALAMFSAALVGCRGEIDVDDNDRDSYSRKETVKKTTDDDGTRTTRTEVKKTQRD